MRSLIRPTLFAVARLGIFLAVTAWIVTEGRAVHGQVGPLKLDIYPHGFVTSLVRYHSLRPIIYSSKATYGWPSNMYFEDTSSYGLGEVSFWSPVPGFAYAAHGGPGGTAKTLSMRHWLVTLLFVAFNMALHFTYRKRPEGQPCED